jgi:hypothetical protein
VVIDVFFFLLAISTIGELVGFQLIGPGVHKPSGKIAVVAASVAGVFVIIGILMLRRNRLTAYRWFDRALLLRILVVQVFLFQEEQFAATLGLAVDLFVWAMLRSAMTIEEQRQDTALDAEVGAGAEATAPDQTS